MVKHPSPLVEIAGTGTAATWTKADDAAVTSFTGADGTPIGLTPGRTWIALVPSAPRTHPASRAAPFRRPAPGG